MPGEEIGVLRVSHCSINLITFLVWPYFSLLICMLGLFHCVTRARYVGDSFAFLESFPRRFPYFYFTIGENIQKGASFLLIERRIRTDVGCAHLVWVQTSDPLNLITDKRPHIRRGRMLRSALRRLCKL